MKNERKPRHIANKLGMAATAQHYFHNTWIEPEAFCYGGKGMLRYAKCINAANGKHIIVKCGLPDSLFSIPATGGFVMHQIEGSLAMAGQEGAPLGKGLDLGPVLGQSPAETVADNGLVILFLHVGYDPDIPV